MIHYDFILRVRYSSGKPTGSALSKVEGPGRGLVADSPRKTMDADRGNVAFNSLESVAIGNTAGRNSQLVNHG